MLKFDQATHMWSLSWAQDKDLVRSPYLCDELCSFPCFQICPLVLQVSKPRFDATRLSKIHTCAKMKMFKGYVYCIDLYRVFEVDLAVYDSMINFDSLPFSWRSQAVASLNLTLRKEADVKRKRKRGTGTGMVLRNRTTLHYLPCVPYVVEFLQFLRGSGELHENILPHWKAKRRKKSRSRKKKKPRT